MNRTKLEVITEEGVKVLYEPSEPEIPNSNALAEYDHFLECIQTDRRPFTDGREGMKSHGIVWKIYEHRGTKLQIGV